MTADSGQERERARVSGPPAADPDRLEKYFDRMLAKCEAAKSDLEKNWTLQIGSIAACIALIAGLGADVSAKYLGSAENYRVLYFVLPIINTYLFVRFGSLATVFSNARRNAEEIAEQLRDQEYVPKGIDISNIYQTNSQFEYVHHQFGVAKFIFSLSIPFVFALNHATTIFLVYDALGITWQSILIFSVYAAIVCTCYVTYYKGNNNKARKEPPKHDIFLLCVVGASLLFTAALLFAASRLHRESGVSPRASSQVPTR